MTYCPVCEDLSKTDCKISKVFGGLISTTVAPWVVYWVVYSEKVIGLIFL